MQLEKYLDRIGLEGPVPASLEGLRRIHRAHLLSIAYENLDVQLGRPVSLAPQAIFEKLVDSRRGGWCYEMNGLLGWALAEQGFRVSRATGAVMREVRGADSIGNHLVLKVELEEGVYLADVGFGDGPLDPIALVPGDFVSHGLDFHLSRLDEDWWRLRNHPKGGAPSFDFNLDPANEAVLAERCRWLQSSDESIFVQNLVCQRYTDTGLVILRGRVLRRVTGRDSDDCILRSADELVSVLATEFGLAVPQAAELWPAICARHEAVFSH